jgi:hypothetical protein
MEDLGAEVEDELVDEPKKAPVSRCTFTQALEESGALDLLVDSLLTLYTNPKQPPELFNFFLTTTGAAEQPDVEKLLLENQDLRKKLAGLKQQIRDLETRPKK